MHDQHDQRLIDERRSQREVAEDVKACLTIGLGEHRNASEAEQVA